MTSGVRAIEAALEDRYRIERELGRGGMATVLGILNRALSDRYTIERALKVLRPVRLTDAWPAPSGRGGAGVAEAAIGLQGPERYSMTCLEAASSLPVGSLAFRG